MKHIIKLKSTLSLIAFCAVLNGCGENDANNAPVITSTAVVSATVGAEYSYILVATDADGDALTLTASTLPAWLTFDASTGALTGTPAVTEVGDHAVTLGVSDGEDSIEESFTITVSMQTNTPPTVTSVAVANATVDTAYSYTLAATDAEGDDLTLSAPTLPTWLAFDAASGALTGTPTMADLGEHAVTLTVNDGEFDTSQSFVITVARKGDEIAELTVFADTVAPDWSVWGDDGSSQTFVTDADASYGEVVEYSTAGSTAVGFSTRSDLGGSGQAYDASSFAASGTLEFDLKMIAAPATDIWIVKIEGTGAVEIDLPRTPVLDTWEHYSINLSSLGDLSALDNIMIFPNWADNAGAVYRVDNVKLFATGGISSTTGGDLIIDIRDGIDFEGSVSEQARWETFENGDPSPGLEFVSNPDQTGNTSAGVAKLVLNPSDGGMWGGAVTHTVQSFALDSSNAIVRLWVYKDKISPIGIKFEKRHGDGWGAHPPRFATNTQINVWEELTIDFSADIGLPENDAIEGIAIFPDNVDGRTSDAIIYFDNITFGSN